MLLSIAEYYMVNNSSQRRTNLGPAVKPNSTGPEGIAAVYKTQYFWVHAILEVNQRASSAIIYTLLVVLC